MLGRRALLIGLLASLCAGAAMAQNAAPASTRPATPPRRLTPEERRQRRQAEKTVTTPEPHGKPAPVPNRDIEAPRGLNEAPRARLSPTVIDPAPAQPHLGGSGFAMQAQEDRLLQKPMPGARLNVPF
ncbi:MAG: hypothetical protein ACK4Y5_19965 [Acetobacteraceae bacterium]|jgi:hypothetical protein|nr:hypothetical protein [Roseomonas sp.]